MKLEVSMLSYRNYTVIPGGHISRNLVPTS